MRITPTNGTIFDTKTDSFLFFLLQASPQIFPRQDLDTQILPKQDLDAQIFPLLKWFPPSPTSRSGEGNAAQGPLVIGWIDPSGERHGIQADREFDDPIISMQNHDD